MIWNRLIMNDEIINKKYTFWEKNIIDNIHCFEDFVRCGIPLWQPRYFFLYIYICIPTALLWNCKHIYFAESHIPHISGFFSLRSSPPFLPHHFLFSDSPWSQISSHPFHHSTYMFLLRINPLSHQYWYNPEFLVLT